jgi:hypothetical protein
MRVDSSLQHRPPDGVIPAGSDIHVQDSGHVGRPSLTIDLMEEKEQRGPVEHIEVADLRSGSDSAPSCHPLPRALWDTTAQGAVDRQIGTPECPLSRVPRNPAAVPPE